MTPKEMSDQVDQVLNETEDFLKSQGVDLFVAVTSPKNADPDTVGLWVSDKATKEQIYTSIFSAFGHIVGMMPNREKIKAICDVLHLGSDLELLYMVTKNLDNPEEK